jgi:hypothetical protein
VILNAIKYNNEKNRPCHLSAQNTQNKKNKTQKQKKNLKQKQLQHKVFVDDCTTKKRK